jgi:hypothetical protein
MLYVQAYHNLVYEFNNCNYEQLLQYFWIFQGYIEATLTLALRPTIESEPEANYRHDLEIYIGI